MFRNTASLFTLIDVKLLLFVRATVPKMFMSFPGMNIFDALALIIRSFSGKDCIFGAYLTS